MSKSLLLFFTAFSVAASLSFGAAMDTAVVDAEGVLRWSDGSEVALVGVNYYPPFSVDYSEIQRRGLDHKAVIRQDVAHFRRLGLGCVRLHCFDRQFSTADGGFIDNGHVELLDYLIGQCSKVGIYTVLTPIAWWGGESWVGKTGGFSDQYPMREMTGNRAAWASQAKFLKAFAEHVNRYTGKRYADDPAVLAFECINEPTYPDDMPDAKLTEYIDTLADALRASGTKKPIYYNSWGGRNAAAGAARIDGVTCSYYPTGLMAGHALDGPQLAKIQASTLQPDASIARKSRMAYEFEAADTPGSYMYPAMGRLFRHEGLQVASQFQYDPMALADVNLDWQTHYLNLVYTPRKAVSLAIMAEVFKRVPRGTAYSPEAFEMSFPPFFVSATNNLSECVTSNLYLYTNDPRTPPPAPGALERVWGCGRSGVVRWPGSGAYFLDRAAAGVWRMQVYPDIFECADPYSGTEEVKRIVLYEKHPLAVDLPDLGDAFTVWAWPDRRRVGRVPRGEARELLPGDYLLTRTDEWPGDAVAERAQAVAPEYVAPPPVADRSPRVVVKVPRQWKADVPMPVEMYSIFADRVSASVNGEPLPEFERGPVFPAEVMKAGMLCLQFFANGTVPVQRRGLHGVGWFPAGEGRPLLGASQTNALVEVAGETGLGKCKGREFPFAVAPMPGGQDWGLRIVAVNQLKELAKLEVGFRMENGWGCGCNISLPSGRNEMLVPPDQLRLLWGLPNAEAFDWRTVRKVSLLTGSWLWDGLSYPAQRVSLERVDWVPMKCGFGVSVVASARDWRFFDIADAMSAPIWEHGVWRYESMDDAGRRAMHVQIGSFTGVAASVGIRIPCASDGFARFFPGQKSDGALILHARAVFPQTTRCEFVFIELNGMPWGTEVPLTTQWRDIRVPFSGLRFFDHWKSDCAPSPGQRPDIRRAGWVNFCFGKWLFPERAGDPHGIEVSDIRIE